MVEKVIITFGEMLKEEFLKPLGISQYRLAKAIGVSATTINKIANDKTALTPDIAYKFSLFFGNSFESWLNLKNLCDMQAIEEKYRGKKLVIIPYNKSIQKKYGKKQMA